MPAQSAPAPERNRPGPDSRQINPAAWITPCTDLSDHELDQLVRHGLCTRRPHSDGDDPWYPFQAGRGPEREAIARAACRGCPVTQACLERTLRVEASARAVWGIAGATSEKRRRALLRRTNWTWPIAPASAAEATSASAA